MKKGNNINFLLQKIQTEQFALFEETFNEKSPVNLNTQIEFKLNSEDKMIGCYIGFIFGHESIPFLKIEVSCHFGMGDNSWNNFLDTKKNIITIPKDFLAHLAMLTVGTTRGVLFAKTEGTIFNNFIIPTLNVSDMIQQDAVFS